MCRAKAVARNAGSSKSRRGKTEFKVNSALSAEFSKIGVFPGCCGVISARPTVHICTSQKHGYRNRGERVHKVPELFLHQGTGYRTNVQATQVVVDNYLQLARGAEGLVFGVVEMLFEHCACLHRLHAILYRK